MKTNLSIGDLFIHKTGLTVYYIVEIDYATELICVEYLDKNFSMDWQKERYFFETMNKLTESPYFFYSPVPQKSGVK